MTSEQEIPDAVVDALLKNDWKKAYKILFRSDTDMKRSLEILESLGDLGPEVEHLKSFVHSSERGVIM